VLCDDPLGCRGDAAEEFSATATATKKGFQRQANFGYFSYALCLTPFEFRTQGEAQDGTGDVQINIAQ